MMLMKTLEILRKNNSSRLFYSLILFTALCFVEGIVRIYVAGNLKGLFLVWNLFLACIPLWLAYRMNKYFHSGKYKVFVLILTGAIWLLFLPNAPYIITDLIHLRPRDGIPMWYDATIFFSFALVGLLTGLLSMYFVHEILKKIWKDNLSWIMLSAVCMLSGYGIYLGRVLRWNSWDILSNPFDLFMDCMLRVANPTAIAITLLYSSLMFCGYILFYNIIHLKSE
jgi:uncharacterized membrane protein